MTNDDEIGFYLSKEEFEKAKSWMKAHDLEKHIEPGETRRYSGAIGGAYTWCFTPTSLGTVCTIKCSCDANIDLTDYDSW
jgi:hypothetical protein